jgi:hypothetical protein
MQQGRLDEDDGLAFAVLHPRRHAENAAGESVIGLAGVEVSLIQFNP